MGLKLTRAIAWSAPSTDGPTRRSVAGETWTPSTVHTSTITTPSPSTAHIMTHAPGTPSPTPASHPLRKSKTTSSTSPSPLERRTIMKLHKSSPSRFSPSTCLPPLLLPSSPPHSEPTCCLHHLPDSHSPSQPTFFATMAIAHHLPVSRTQIWLKRIHSHGFLLLRRSVRSNDPACPSSDHQLQSLPLPRPPPLFLFPLSPLPPSLLLLPCLLLLSPCLSQSLPPSLPVPRSSLIVPPLSFPLFQLLSCLLYPLPPLLCPLPQSCLPPPLPSSHLPLLHPLPPPLLSLPLPLLPLRLPTPLSNPCQFTFQMPAQLHGRALSRKSKSSMSKPPVLRKQQASSLQMLLTNQTKSPNLPVHANQPIRCHYTRSTSRSAVGFLTPSANTVTTMIVTPAYHTTRQRRFASPTVQ